MALKKGWEQRKIRENCMGWHFDRWYLKSPAGNFYELFRSEEFGSQYITSATIYLEQDTAHVLDHKVERQIEPMAMKQYINGYGWKRLTWNEVLKKIYEIEDSGTYSKALSDAIENYPECKQLYALPETSFKINTY